jgi:hypothetical protein
MLAGPKDKSEAKPVGGEAVSRPDPVSPVSLIVALALVALGAGGVLAVFSGPLFALGAH